MLHAASEVHAGRTERKVKIMSLFNTNLTASKLAVIILDIVSMFPAAVVLFSHGWRVVGEVSVTVITIVTRHELLQ
jgi:hypothetical protein